ncbi:uncharacterized protein [Epargyreus clarus]|uniref:uncharacterized protein n=1 Tax=Epargyreus clarus TaxID=520877 RepID=UPI003C2E3543
MNNERLIEAVRKYPALYNMSDGKYMDSNYKSSLWVKISEEIKQTDVNCKKRWSNIRDQFKRSLNNRKTKSGQSSTVIKKYKYEEILQFLLPYIQDRKTRSNIDDDDADTNESEIQQEQESQETGTYNNQSMQEIRNEEDTDSERGVIGDRATEVQRNDQFTTQQSGQSSNRSSAKVSKRRTVPHKQSSSDTLMKYILENNAKKQNEYNKSHPIDDFFNGLSSTVKTFSPYYQHVAKRRLFAVVQELEFEQMYNESTSSSSASSPIVINELTPSSSASTPIMLQYTEIPPSASTVLDSSRQSQDSTGTEQPSISPTVRLLLH